MSAYDAGGDVSSKAACDMRPCALIVCYAANGVIGREGDLPWKEPEDARYFREVTWGHCVIMGRVTFESLPGPLPGRTMCVLTRKEGYSAAGGHVFPSLDTALTYAYTQDDMPFICGGEAVYRAALPRVTRAYITVLPYAIEGDKFFPREYIEGWREIERKESNGRIFSVYDRGI